jgi:hypothetical protein
MSDENRQDLTIKAEPGIIASIGNRPGVIIESASGPDGRTVDARPPSGGRSLSSVDSSGTLTADLSGRLERGTDGQWHVLKVLVEALRGRGDTVERLPAKDARDDRGEDGMLSLNGKRVPVQAVSLPVDKSTWKELSSRGATSIEGAAVEIIRQALVLKKGKAAGTILALDAAHIGAIASPSVVAAYVAKHGDPEKEFGLLEAWIVAPTVGSTIRLLAE